MSRLREQLMEKKISDGTISGHIANEFQKAYDILEDLDIYVSKLGSKFNKNTEKEKNIEELRKFLGKVMQGMDVAKVIKLTEKAVK